MYVNTKLVYEILTLISKKNRRVNQSIAIAKKMFAIKRLLSWNDKRNTNTDTKNTRIRVLVCSTCLNLISKNDIIV